MTSDALATGNALVDLCDLILIIAILPALVLAGCGPSAVDDALTVATTWPAREREDWEERARRSAAARPIRWLVLAPGDDVARLANRRGPPDLILGASALDLEALSRRGLLEPGAPGGPAWRMARARALGHVESAGRSGRVSPPAVPTGLTIDDPRRDPVAREWARAVLGAGAWAEGYARLVRSARGNRPPGRRPRAALSAVLRGESETAYALDFDELTARGVVFFANKDQSCVEGIAAVRGARHATDARALLDDMDANSPPTLAGFDADKTASPAADDLLGDLLGSTLVDADEERRDAWAAVARTGWRERSEPWLTEAPPWPPASVAKILRREANAMPMVETLAAQVAPEADVRAWLLRSWLGPARHVDGRLLNELAAAADGRLVREPRFRAWLRCEWTAWARQRYRRVARQVRAGQGAS